jgi:FRG domain
VDEFKAFANGLEHRRYIFRGQRELLRLRTGFHRTGRADLSRFLANDIQTLHRHLSSRMGHIFNLSIPDENGAFFNLVQHHGYPTPLLDWTYSSSCKASGLGLLIFNRESAQILAIQGKFGTTGFVGRKVIMEIPGKRSNQRHSILINKGIVVDGTGAPRRLADVAVTGGGMAEELIVEIGKMPDSARKVIDASDLVLSPGFRSAYELRRADMRGSVDRVLVMPWRDFGGDGQLRRRHRAIPD